MNIEPYSRNPIAAGMVLYARHPDRVCGFYAAVVELGETQRGQEFVVLERGGFQLVVVAVPDRIGQRIVIADPPCRRVETPIKPMFVVRGIEVLRDTVAKLGGVLDPAEKAWRFGCWRVLDGHDPEGNVFQLRECTQPHE